MTDDNAIAVLLAAYFGVWIALRVVKGKLPAASSEREKRKSDVDFGAPATPPTSGPAGLPLDHGAGWHF